MKPLQRQIGDKIQRQLLWLQNLHDFNPSSKPKVIPQFYVYAQYKKLSNFSILKKNIERSFLLPKNKDVFCLLKWLITIHSVIKNLRSQKILIYMIELLMKMPKIQFKINYEQYIHKSLVSIYQQYLIKLAHLSCIICSIKSPSEKENPNKNVKQLQLMKNILYCQYNIVNYASREFQKPINEFTKLFEKFYPSLNAYVLYMAKDVDKFYRRIRLNYEADQYKFLSYQEIQKIGRQIIIFNIDYKKYLDSNNYPNILAQSFDIKQETQQKENRQKLFNYKKEDRVQRKRQNILQQINLN